MPGLLNGRGLGSTTTSFCGAAGGKSCGLRERGWRCENGVLGGLIQAMIVRGHSNMRFQFNSIVLDTCISLRARAAKRSTAPSAPKARAREKLGIDLQFLRFLGEFRWAMRPISERVCVGYPIQSVARFS